MGKQEKRKRRLSPGDFDHLRIGFYLFFGWLLWFRELRNLHGKLFQLKSKFFWLLRLPHLF